MRTAFTERFGVEHPLVQAGMGVEAGAALAARPDAIVAQGNEAGGHTGRRGTLAFAAQVLDLADDVPVLVAGGIGTGRGLAAALAMGAAGAVVGTRFKPATSSGVLPSSSERSS